MSDREPMTDEELEERARTMTLFEVEARGVDIDDDGALTRIYQESMVKIMAERAGLEKLVGVDPATREATTFYVHPAKCSRECLAELIDDRRTRRQFDDVARLEGVMRERFD